MDLDKAVDRYALLAFDLARRVGTCSPLDHLRGSELGRIPMPDRAGPQWAVRLRIQRHMGRSRRGVDHWGGERLMLARLEVPDGASQEVAVRHLVEVAATGVVPVPSAVRRVL